MDVDDARQQAFLRICERCCEALHVLDRLREGRGGNAPDPAEMDAALRERCLALECPLAEFKPAN